MFSCASNPQKQFNPKLYCGNTFMSFIQMATMAVHSKINFQIHSS